MTELITEAARGQAVEIVLRILKGAVAAKASDIHLRAGVPPLVRIEGELCPLEHPPLPPAVVEAAVIALASWAGVTGDRLTQKQIDFSCEVPDIGRFRGHGYRESGNRALVLRQIKSPIPDFAALRLPPIIKRIALSDRGMVLVTGATGNGKSTTIAAILDYINKSVAKHVVTIEDPIEYIFEDQMASFSQREIGRDVENPHEGLMGALREDPDVLFIGEIRTLEEFDVALSAAESGRMVISTFHSTDTGRAVQRMINMYPSDQRDSARQRIADSLAGIIAQRLVARRGGRERILVTEVLTRNPTVQDCIRDPNRTRGLQAALEAGTNEYGSHSFDQQLIQFVRDGHITVDTARAAANNPSDLVRTLKLAR